jgi:hypothetical protein
VEGLARKISKYWGWESKKQDGNSDDKPTDDELAERWLESHPEYAYGQGEWKRYLVSGAETAERRLCLCV